MLKLLPFTIMLAVYILLAGNATVLYIYVQKFKVYSSGRFFISILAVIDMVSGVVNSACLMSETLLPVKFYSDIGCKIIWFLCMSTCVTSMFLLPIIAIDRYLKNCRPFGKQMVLIWRNL